MAERLRSMELAARDIADRLREAKAAAEIATARMRIQITLPSFEDFRVRAPAAASEPEPSGAIPLYI